MPIVTIILEEAHLREASYDQFERFWRVWYSERSFYAPALQTLVLGLRGPPKTPAEADGIRRFIAYFHTDVYPRARHVGLDVYHLDSQNDDTPTRLFRILPAAQTLPAPHTLNGMALHRNG
jgi:hypothetical protein